MRNFVDRTGHKYGKLTVVKLSHTANKQTYWECLCDCGNEKITTGRSLHYFGNATGSGVGSCGCLHAEVHKKKRLNDKIAGLNKIFTHYKQGAKKRDLSFKLTKTQFEELISSNCYYCGCPPGMIAHPSKRISLDPLLYNGIDRVNNNTGYELSNCVPCCKYCNNSKNNRTKEEFLEWIENVYKTSYLI